MCGPYITPISPHFPFPDPVFGWQLKAKRKTKCSPWAGFCSCCFSAYQDCGVHRRNGVRCTGQRREFGAAERLISLVRRARLLFLRHHANNARQRAMLPTQGWILVYSKRKLLSGSHLSFLLLLARSAFTLCSTLPRQGRDMLLAPESSPCPESSQQHE